METLGGHVKRLALRAGRQAYRLSGRARWRSGATRKDIGASVRARLLRLAREQSENFQLVLTRYANERLLFRLASSRHAQRFVLKGAALFTCWTGKPHRATRDLDLLGFGDSGADHVREVFAEVLTLDVP